MRDTNKLSQIPFINLHLKAMKVTCFNSTICIQDGDSKAYLSIFLLHGDTLTK